MISFGIPSIIRLALKLEQYKRERKRKRTKDFRIILAEYPQHPEGTSKVPAVSTKSNNFFFKLILVKN